MTRPADFLCFGDPTRPADEPDAWSTLVWYCHIPGHWLSSGPWQESGSIWAFVIIPHQADWLYNCWHLSSLDRSPRDVIQMTVTLFSGSASAAG